MFITIQSIYPLMSIFEAKVCYLIIKEKDTHSCNDNNNNPIDMVVVVVSLYPPPESADRRYLVAEARWRSGDVAGALAVSVYV